MNCLDASLAASLFGKILNSFVASQPMSSWTQPFLVCFTKIPEWSRSISRGFAMVPLPSSLEMMSVLVRSASDAGFGFGPRGVECNMVYNQPLSSIPAFSCVTVSSVIKQIGNVEPEVTQKCIELVVTLP